MTTTILNLNHVKTTRPKHCKKNYNPVPSTTSPTWHSEPSQVSFSEHFMPDPLQLQLAPPNWWARIRKPTNPTPSTNTSAPTHRIPTNSLPPHQMRTRAETTIQPSNLIIRRSRPGVRGLVVTLRLREEKRVWRREQHKTSRCEV